MFEGLVAEQLNKYLGKYIQNLDTENLNVGIFSGEFSRSTNTVEPILRDHPIAIGHKKCGLSRQVVSGDRFSYIEM